MGYLMGLQVHFYVFLLSIYPPNMVFIRNFLEFSGNITGKGFPTQSDNSCGHLRESGRTFGGKDESV